MNALVGLIYLVSAIMFVVGIKRLAKVKTARSGNQLAAGAMGVAILGTFLEMNQVDPGWVIVGIAIGASIGTYAALKVEMTSMPEMVAIFNGLGGAASALVPLAVFWEEYVSRPNATAQTVSAVMGADDVVTIILSVVIGGVTFTGSIVAFLKLQGRLAKGNPILLPGRHQINLALAGGVLLCGVFFGFLSPFIFTTTLGLLALSAVALVLGVLLVIPIGGADMPVVVSLLNSYSGVAASMAGFVIGNPLLVVGGALVGASGLILTQIMCVAMNRSLLNVLVGGFGQTDGQTDGGSSEYTNVTSSGPEEAAMVLEAATSVIIVPGYGLAVAQAQHTIRELADHLKGRDMKVTYAIHPVAGRMPGHMNVLLAEADVPYEELVEMDSINGEFRNTDVVIVLGANDVVNPEAIDNKTSPIYGMPILNAHEARTVFVVKRSLSPGYAGIKNPLFELDNTMMLFGDAKKIVQDLLKEMKEL